MFTCKECGFETIKIKTIGGHLQKHCKGLKKKFWHLYVKGLKPVKLSIKEIKQVDKKKKVTKLSGSNFYSTREWRKLRYQALVKHGSRCMACGRTPDHGIVIHVDHIKPRSKYPKLQLKLSNLQILCEDCNMGKSNRDDTDWRKEEIEPNGLDIEFYAIVKNF